MADKDDRWDPRLEDVMRQILDAMESVAPPEQHDGAAWLTVEAGDRVTAIHRALVAVLDDA